MNEKSSERPLLELRPDIPVAIIPVIVSSFVFALFWGVLVWSFLRSIIAAVVIAMLTIAATIFFRFMNLNARKYIFYTNKAEFYEGFLNIVQRTVQYSRVTDCVLTKTVWDRLFGTGTIRLVTAGHEGGGYRYSVLGGGTMMGGGISIQYVKNPDQVFQKVQELLGTK